MRRTFLRLAISALVLIGLFSILAMLPEVLPDHGVVSHAIYEGDLERVSGLLDRGADPNSRRDTLSTICKFLSRTGRYHSDIVLDFGERDPLLTVALQRRQPAIARLLLERGADPNVADQYGQSPLALAREAEETQLVELLLQKGAR